MNENPDVPADTSRAAERYFPYIPVNVGINNKNNLRLKPEIVTPNARNVPITMARAESFIFAIQ